MAGSTRKALAPRARDGRQWHAANGQINDADMMHTPLPQREAIMGQATRQEGLNRRAGSTDQDKRGVRLRTNVSITLQSTVGGFSGEFMRKLPRVEQAMIAHGLDPSAFVISKDPATPPTVPFIGPFFYAYTVFVGEESFTVTEPNDIKFLDYFLERCIAEDEVTPEQEQQLRRRRAGLISRLFRWMAQQI
jgi:hypothetical protein